MQEVDCGSLLCNTKMTHKYSNVFINRNVLLFKVDSLQRVP